MEFLTNTEILLAMLIVPAALALDWAIRNGNWDSIHNSAKEEDDGWTFGSQGYGYYLNGLKMSDDDEIKTVFDDD